MQEIRKEIYSIIDLYTDCSERKKMCSSIQDVIESYATIKNPIVPFIKSLIEKEENMKNQLKSNMELYTELGKKNLYETSFSLWNKQNLIIWDLKDILCRMGLELDEINKLCKEK